MNIIIKIFYSILIIITIVSCNNEYKTINTNTPNSISNDTIISIEKPIEEIVDTLPSNCSKEEAIKFIQNSDFWNEYSTGIIPSLIDQHLPYAQRLINNKFDNFIIVDKNTMMVILYDKFGNRVLNFKMACGKNYGHKQKKADSRTPEGYFLCGGRFDSTDWLFTDDNGYTSPIKGQFGPRFIRVTTQIGIHGTNARYSIGRRCSHGCIRIQNEQILYLYKYAKKGMPIIVNPGKRDVTENEKAGIDMPAIILPDTVIEHPIEFLDFKEEYFKEKARKDSIEKAEALKEAHRLDSIKALDSINKLSSDSTIHIEFNDSDSI